MARPSSSPGTGARAHVPCPFCGRLNDVDLARIDDRPRCAECGRPILLDRPIKVSDANFERVITGADVPVLADFYADWCGPCKTMSPTVDELAADRAGEILVVKLDTDRNRTTTERFGIRGIPTFIVFRNGREAARHSGSMSRAELDRLIGTKDGA